MSTNRITVKRFQRGWRILLVIIAIFWIASLVWSIFTTPIYRASAKFLVYPNDSLTSSRDVVSSLDTLDKKTVSTTYADILDSNRVYLDTIERLKLSPESLEKVKVYSDVQIDSNILVLSVEGPDPQMITLLANNIGQNGISFIKSIYQVFDITFLDLAVEPSTPFHPNPAVDGLIAAGIGLVAGLFFLILRESLRIPLEVLRERTLTDKQSLAFSKKYMLRCLTHEVLDKKTESFAFGLIYLQGLEDLIEGLPEIVTTGVMQNITKRLHDLLRGNDIVARWDRLTFSVLLPSTPETPAVKTFERLMQSLDQSLQLDSGDSILLTPVAGLVIKKIDDTSEKVIQRGEDALSSARAGKNKIVLGKE
jgi:capsular polysaccharide biosynthesis protein/GGDEF domain-containing protein